MTRARQIFQLCLTLLCMDGFAQTASLGSYNIDPQGITISGISSGAYMAVQMEVAYSSVFSGAASVAGGVYWCAKGDSNLAQTACMSQPSNINVNDQINQAKSLATAGSIDPIKDLANHKVYIYASPKDSIINPVNSDKLQEFLTAFMDPSHITTVHTVNSAHGFPTLKSGNPCTMAMLPWILNCNYDTAGAILQSMYGTLKPPVAAVNANLISFSQADFGDASTPLYASGWVYVPSACAAGAACKLHVALHGCQMNPQFIQAQFENLTGFNEWAESNNIIVLYPQSAMLNSANPYACWDWFGFTGSNYVTKSGRQMTALKKMVDRVRGN